MAALDFPASPTDGQVYGNWIYNTAKGAWKAKPLTSLQTPASTTPPLNPNAGDTWFNSTDATLYIYYNDGNTSQWVEARAPITSDGYYSPNYIINGGFDIWQRGTSFSAAGYTADRWNVVAASGQTVAVSQQTFTPGAAPVVGYEGTYYSRIVWSGTPSGYFWYNQKVEDVRTLSGQTVTLSFWAKASTATSALNSTIEFNMGTGGSGGVTLNGSALSITTSWARYSTTFTLPSMSGKTIGTNSYLDVRLLQGNSSVAGINIDIWGAQLESGAVATPFRRNANSLQGELAACQRYYQVISTSPADVNIMGVRESATQFTATFWLPVTLRSIPTLTKSTTNYGRIVGRDTSFNTTTVTVSAIALSGAHPSLNAITVIFTHGSMVGTYLFSEWDNYVSALVLGLESEL